VLAMLNIQYHTKDNNEDIMNFIKSTILHFLTIVMYIAGIIMIGAGLFSCILTTDTSQGWYGLIIGLILISIAYAIRHYLGTRIRF